MGHESFKYNTEHGVDCRASCNLIENLYNYILIMMLLDSISAKFRC